MQYVPLADSDVVPMESWFVTVDLPFPVTLRDRTVSSLDVEKQGALFFGVEGPASLWLDPFYGNWVVDDEADIRIATRGAAPDRHFVVEWRNVRHYDIPDLRVTFQAIADEAGGFSLVHPGNDGTYFVAGGESRVGVEYWNDDDWDDEENWPEPANWIDNGAFFADDTPTLRSGFAVRIDPLTP